MPQIFPWSLLDLLDLLSPFAPAGPGPDLPQFALAPVCPNLPQFDPVSVCPSWSCPCLSLPRLNPIGASAVVGASALVEPLPRLLPLPRLEPLACLVLVSLLEPLPFCSLPQWLVRLVPSLDLWTTSILLPEYTQVAPGPPGSVSGRFTLLRS